MATGVGAKDVVLGIDDFRRTIFVAAYLGTLVGLTVGTAWVIDATVGIAGGLVIGAGAGAGAGVVIVLVAALAGWVCRTGKQAVRGGLQGSTGGRSGYVGGC